MGRNDDVPKQVRVRTDPDDGYAHRYDTIQDAAAAWDCNQTRAVLLSCELAEQALTELPALLEDDRLPPEIAADLAEQLDALRHVDVDYEPPTASVTPD